MSFSANAAGCLSRGETRAGISVWIARRTGSGNDIANSGIDAALN